MYLFFYHYFQHQFCPKHKGKGALPRGSATRQQHKATEKPLTSALTVFTTLWLVLCSSDVSGVGAAWMSSLGGVVASAPAVDTHRHVVVRLLLCCRHSPPGRCCHRAFHILFTDIYEYDIHP